MKKIFKDFIGNFFERALSTLAFIFPFVEVSTYFGPKVFLASDSAVLKTFYVNYIAKLTAFYTENIYVVFILMVWIFITCSRGSAPLTKFVRFNVIQAILLNIICTCLGFIFNYLPVVLRESMIGAVFSNFLYLGIILLIAYSSLLIAYGRYPKIPVISEAAKLQVQQGS
jgi:hypothetical protein